MLLQTNSYMVPQDKRSEHARLVKRFKQTLARLGCDRFEVYELVGNNWQASKTPGRFVQIMRFKDRAHHRAVQEAERADQAAQELIAEFCALVDFEQQQHDGMYAIGFYNSVLPVANTRAPNAILEEPHAVTIATDVDVNDDQLLKVLPVSEPEPDTDIGTETEPELQPQDEDIAQELPVVEIDEQQNDSLDVLEIENEEQHPQPSPVAAEPEEFVRPAQVVAHDEHAEPHAPGSNGNGKAHAQPAPPEPAQPQPVQAQPPALPTSQPSRNMRPNVTVVPHRGVQMFTIPIGRPVRKTPPTPTVYTQAPAASAPSPAGHPGNGQPHNHQPPTPPAEPQANTQAGAFQIPGTPTVRPPQTPGQPNPPQDPKAPTNTGSFTVGRLSRL